MSTTKTTIVNDFVDHLISAFGPSVNPQFLRDCAKDFLGGKGSQRVSTASSTFAVTNRSQNILAQVLDKKGLAPKVQLKNPEKKTTRSKNSKKDSGPRVKCSEKTAKGTPCSYFASWPEENPTMCKRHWNIHSKEKKSPEESDKGTSPKNSPKSLKKKKNFNISDLTLKTPEPKNSDKLPTEEEITKKVEEVMKSENEKESEDNDYDPLDDADTSSESEDDLDEEDDFSEDELDI